MNDASCKFGGALRGLRKIAESAKNDRREGLGPEVAGFEVEDLKARQFVHKYVFGDLNADQGAQQQPACQAAPNGTPLPPGERPRPTRTRPEPTGLTVRGKQFRESACRAPRWAGRFPCTIQATTQRRGQ